jgi:hypothetical protein
MATYKHWYTDCKGCSGRITLEIYTGNMAVANLRNENLRCPVCLDESKYSGGDFKTNIPVTTSLGAGAIVGYLSTAHVHVNLEHLDDSAIPVNVDHSVAVVRTGDYLEY